MARRVRNLRTPGSLTTPLVRFLVPGSATEKGVRRVLPCAHASDLGELNPYESAEL